MGELFDAPAVYTREMKIEALKRELGFRRSVYARRVSDGKMTQAKADKEIGVMEAILADYEAKR